jgi:phage RecT family recombinase
MACLQTEAGRISLKHALRFAATTGLSLNPQEGKAALVPINGKINYWPMKNGLVELALGTGAVHSIRMNAIRQNDHWKLTESMDGDRFEFGPARKNRGEIDGFFCAIKLKDGSSVVEYMPRDEVEDHKKRYGKGANREDSAWNTSFEGMGIKTVVKRAIKRLALPPEAVTVMDAALGEAEPVQFEEVTAKGASAQDVETKLADQQQGNTHTGITTGGESTDPGHPSTSGSTPAGAPGSAPSTPEDAEGNLDIF